jgi:hypothetical protein
MLRTLPLTFLLIIAFLAVSCGSKPFKRFVQPPQPTPTPIRQPTQATADCTPTSVNAPPVHNLQELLPGCDYPTWFEDNTGYAADPAYFASYAFLPDGQTLYLGFGKARPAEANGALFSKYENTTLTAIYQPSEQGFIEMTHDIAEPVIHIPGPDPTDPAPPDGGSQWDWGNTYVYTPTTQLMTKHRNLPNVIHTWGLESTSDGLYAAVSSHMGDYETWTGEVFRSQDGGESWTRMANKDAGVGDYRTYDIIQFNNKLYVIWNDALNDPCGLAESADGGTTWTRLPDFSGLTYCRSRLIIYNNQLLALASARDGILALDTNGNVTTHIFPGFRAQDWSYNAFAIDAQNRLYTLTEDNRILRTADLTNWETMAASDRDFMAIAYWPAQDQIVIADRGTAGRIWLLNSTAATVNQPPAPDPTISLDGADVVLAWSDSPGLTYRIYRNDSPDFTPPIQFFHAGVAQSPWRDSGVASAPGAFYYEVRSQNATGDISGPSQTLGLFSYELVPGS